MAGGWGLGAGAREEGSSIFLQPPASSLQPQLNVVIVVIGGGFSSRDR